MDFPGSAPYASPQLVAGEPYDAKAADIWAIGVMLYCMVCGEYPFYSEENSIMMKMIRNNPLTFRYGIATANAEDIISKMLTKDVVVRPTCSDLRKHDWLSDATSSPYHPSPARIKKPIKSKTALRRLIF